MNIPILCCVGRQRLEDGRVFVCVLESGSERKWGRELRLLEDSLRDARILSVPGAPLADGPSTPGIPGTGATETLGPRSSTCAGSLLLFQEASMRERSHPGSETKPTREGRRRGSWSRRVR